MRYMLLRYDGVFGGSWVVEGLAGIHKETSEFSGAGKDIPLYIDRRGARPFPNAGGFGFHSDDDVEREGYDRRERRRHERHDG